MHRGYPIPSPAALGKIGKGFVKDIERFVADNAIPVVRFAKGQCKEDVAAPYLAEARTRGFHGVVLVGVAQEKESAWRGWRDGGSDGHPHFEFARQSVFPNFYYFYINDSQFGSCFIKVCSYAPFSMWVYCNGHEWAKAQAEQEGLGYTALDNGFASCEDPAPLQRICDRFGAVSMRNLFERWSHRLPSPFTAADRTAGFFHQLAFRQIEFSDTRVFDRPGSGRAWFEQTIREHLDLGRPDQVALIFARRITSRTPGRFRTRVITRGVDPSIQIYLKSAKQKQYFKEAQALRTELSINDTRDFGIGRLVTTENFQGRGTHICMNAHGFAHGTLGNRVIPTGHLSRDTPRGFVQRTGQFRSLGTRAADSPRLPSKPVLWRESVGGFDSRPPPQRGFYLQKRVAHRLDGHGL